MDKEKVDVIIVGGGIAGLYAALKLSELGYKIKIFDFNKSRKLDSKTICSAPALSQNTINMLGIEMNKKYAINHIKSDHFTLMTGLSFLNKKNRSNNPIFATRIKDIESQLETKVRKAGIEIIPGLINNLIFNNKKVEGIRIDKQSIKAQLIIDATGRSSQLSRLVNARYPYLVSEYGYSEDSNILGMYVKFSKKKIEDILPKVNANTLLVGLLRGKLIYFVSAIAPSLYGLATHLISHRRK